MGVSSVYPRSSTSRFSAWFSVSNGRYRPSNACSHRVVCYPSQAQDGKACVSSAICSCTWLERCRYKPVGNSAPGAGVNFTGNIYRSASRQEGFHLAYDLESWVLRSFNIAVGGIQQQISGQHKFFNIIDQKLFNRSASEDFHVINDERL